MTASSQFRVRTSVKQGPRGNVVIVRVYEPHRAGFEVPSNTFLFDMQCLPALKAQLDRLFISANTDGYYDAEEEGDDE